MITKLDLAHACEADMKAMHDNLQAIRPSIHVFETSAKTGAGLDEWIAFLVEQRDQRRAAHGARPTTDVRLVERDRRRRANHQSASSPGTGGARAGRAGGTSAGSPRCRRIRAVAAPASSSASNCSRPPPLDTLLGWP